MKDYVSMLSDEEFEWLCWEITGKQFREYFKRNSKEFRKLVLVKRPEKLNDKECIQIAIKNKDNNYIVSFINRNINGWLSSISDYLGKKECPDSDEVISEMLFNSHFVDHISLYFKLIGKNVSQEYIEKVNECICEIRLKLKNEQHTEPEESVEIQTAPDTVSELETQLAEMEQREQKALEQFETEKSAREADAARHKEELELLKKQLTVTQTKVSQLETEMNRLSVFDDSEVIRRISSNYQHISLCRVWGRDKNEIPFVKRMADIDQSGFIHLFTKDESRERILDNRSRLYHRDGPVEIGKYGVWEWSAFPDTDDVTKDKVKCRFSFTFIPVEIIFLSNCDSIDGIINQLISGIEDKPVSSKTIFAVRYSNEIIQGICCTEDHLKTDDGKIKLIEQVSVLPVYQFEEKNCIVIYNRFFYNNISLGKPVKIARIKDSFEMIRQIVLEYINWSSFKQRGINEAEWRNYRAYIEELHSTEIITRISKEFLCSEKEAEELLCEFTDRAAQYIAGDSIEDDILLSILSTNTDLMERCKGLIMTDWQKENDSMMREAEKKIRKRIAKRDEINIEIEQLRATISELTKQKEGLHTIDDINSEIEKLRASISKLTKQEKGLQKIDEINSEIEKLRATVCELTRQKNQLKKEIDDQELRADYIQRSVAEKIEDARKNAADFVKEMSFQYGMNESMNIPYNYIEGEESGFYSEPGCDDWKDLLNHLSEQLVKAGVCKKYSDSFAAFLFSAYLNQFPLLLAGPNAMEIADAFSVTMNGNTAGTLYCKADISYHDIDRILKNDDEIIKIVEPFSCRIIPALFERTSFNKYFFAIHPIAEDIVIEPKGYTNYFYPVLTDMFVDSIPSRVFNQIETNDGYEAYKLTKADKKYVKVLRKLHMSMMTYNRINDVIFNLHKMLDDDSIDYDVLYAILPYAYMTMQTDKLLDAVNSKKIDVNNIVNELNRLFGED